MVMFTQSSSLAISLARMQTGMQAIALGADAVMLGRPVLYGLALQGEEGVRKVLQMLRRELTLAMQLAGCASLQTITQSLVLPFGIGVHLGHVSKL